MTARLQKITAIFVTPSQNTLQKPEQILIKTSLKPTKTLITLKKTQKTIKIKKKVHKSGNKTDR
jgi:hypothetical protein